MTMAELHTSTGELGYIMDPKAHIDRGILQTMASGITLALGLEPESRILMNVWSFGPLFILASGPGAALETKLSKSRSTTSKKSNPSNSSLAVLARDGRCSEGMPSMSRVLVGVPVTCACRHGRPNCNLAKRECPKIMESFGMPVIASGMASDTPTYPET